MLLEFRIKLLLSYEQSEELMFFFFASASHDGFSSAVCAGLYPYIMC